jgi:hypothetical protein
VVLGWLVVDLAGLSGFWPGMIATGLGAILGQLAGSLVFRPPPGGGPRA